MEFGFHPRLELFSAAALAKLPESKSEAFGNARRLHLGELVGRCKSKVDKVLRDLVKVLAVDVGDKFEKGILKIGGNLAKTRWATEVLST